MNIEFGNIINNRFNNNITYREWKEYENIFKDELEKYEKKENIIFVIDEKENSKQVLIEVNKFASSIDYKQKYLKYKQKYLKLKKY